MSDQIISNDTEKFPIKKYALKSVYYFFCYTLAIALPTGLAMLSTFKVVESFCNENDSICDLYSPWSDPHSTESFLESTKSRMAFDFGIINLYSCGLFFSMTCIFSFCLPCLVKDCSTEQVNEDSSSENTANERTGLLDYSRSRVGIYRSALKKAASVFVNRGIYDTCVSITGLFIAYMGIISLIPADLSFFICTEKFSWDPKCSGNFPEANSYQLQQVADLASNAQNTMAHLETIFSVPAILVVSLLIFIVSTYRKSPVENVKKPTNDYGLNYEPNFAI